MMLAQAKHLNVLHNHQLIMPLMEDRSVHNIPHVLLVSPREEQHGFRIPLRCAQQSLPIRIFTYAFENRLNCA